MITSPKDCLFCKIIRKELPAEIIYDDEYFLAFLDINPVNTGHLLLIPKEHHQNILTLPKNISEKLGINLVKLSKIVITATKADGLNIVQNNHQAAGQVIFHLHFHLIPRFKNDGLKSWPSKKIEIEELKSIATTMKTLLSQ